MTNDHKELLKLRQGLVAENESPLEINEKPHYEKPVGFSAVMSNFVYHHKAHIFVVGFFVFVAVGLAIMTFGGEKPDLTVLLIADTEETAAFFHFEQDALQTSLERFVPDFNENGNVFAQLLFIDLVVAENRDPRSYHGNTVKLFGEMQSGKTFVLMGNRAALENIPTSANVPLESFYLNLAELYDDATIPKITDEFFLQLTQTALADDYVLYEKRAMPDDLFLAVRRPPQERADEVLAVLNAIIAGENLLEP